MQSMYGSTRIKNLTFLHDLNSFYRLFSFKVKPVAAIRGEVLAKGENPSEKSNDGANKSGESPRH